MKPYMTYVTELVKEKYGNIQEIQVLYEDQATADFNLLFRNIHGNAAIKSKHFQFLRLKKNR